jgi:plasmid maintenance system antidote protein VapI
MNNDFAPLTPGKMLNKEFLGIRPVEKAAHHGHWDNHPIESSRSSNNRRRITADTAIRLGRYFGNSPEI